MRDFTLPDNLTLRGIAVASYEDELEQTLTMIKACNGQDDGTEKFAELIERARDANRIAFELFYNGIIDEQERQNVVAACKPFLSKRIPPQSAYV